MGVDFGYILKIDYHKRLCFFDLVLENSSTSDRFFCKFDTIWEYLSHSPSDLKWFGNESLLFFEYQGKLITGLWKAISDLPINLQNEFRGKIKSITKKITWRGAMPEWFKPIYLDSMKKKPNAEDVNTHRQNTLKRHSSFTITQPISSPDKNEIRKQHIKDFCIERKIRFLAHYTSTSNLSKILEYGLLSRIDLTKNRIIESVKINDKERHDHRLDAICTTISFPNYRLFYPTRKGNDNSWVVLLLNSSILWQLDCSFSAENAAARNISSVNIEKRKLFNSLKSMFEDFKGIERINLRIPACCPTNPQAEVLIHEPIPVCYIKYLLFNSQYPFNYWRNKLSGNTHSFSLKVKSGYFDKRMDYAFWQNK